MSKKFTHKMKIFITALTSLAFLIGGGLCV